jgi:hypothetical protein
METQDKPGVFAKPSGGAITGYTTDPVPARKEELRYKNPKTGHTDDPDTYLITPDAEGNPVYIGVFLDKDANGMKTIVNETKTKQITSDQAAPLVRKELMGVPKTSSGVLKKPTTTPATVTPATTSNPMLPGSHSENYAASGPESNPILPGSPPVKNIAIPKNHIELKNKISSIK